MIKCNYKARQSLVILDNSDLKLTITIPLILDKYKIFMENPPLYIYIYILLEERKEINKIIKSSP